MVSAMCPSDLGPVVAVAAAKFHTCAVKTSGELVWLRT